MTKHLWEYDNYHLFEVELKKKKKNPCYKSWDDFLLTSADALNCNCTYGDPLVWWFWDENDRLNLIYAMRFSKVSRFVIQVRKSDESKIRSFIKIQQKNTRV